MDTGAHDFAMAFRVADIRAAERQVIETLPAGALMDRAAMALAVVCATVLRQRAGGVYGRRTVLLVGEGNNGGDALLAGAELQRRGVHVVGVLVGTRAHDRGLAALRAAGGRTVSGSGASGRSNAAAAIAQADVVLDGIVGVGGRPGLTDRAAELVEAIPPTATVVAVDLPSGVDPDSGELNGPYVRADITVSFGALKPCLLLPPAAHAAGEVMDVRVGIETCLPATGDVRRLTDKGIARTWPVPSFAGHKYTRGVLGVVAGSDAYPGAAVLAVGGAQRAGVGIVRFIGPRHVTNHVLQAFPEAVPGMGRVQAWLLGSGVESDAQQDAAIAEALGSGLPCVVDAGALSECVQQRSSGVRPAPANSILLTPHAGEAARVLNQVGVEVQRSDVESRPAFYARLMAKLTDSTVLLKGPTTLVASPDGDLFSQNDGTPWHATAGSGDVLAGIAGALMAQGVDAPLAGAMAAYIHGVAGARASTGGPIAAGDIAKATPTAIADLLNAHQRPRGSHQR